jgi:hypothetical protein
MTAKPPQMAGQPDAADDLIAELAKLMAQDAQSERPAEPPRPTFSVRIPGEENPATAPRPNAGNYAQQAPTTPSVAPEAQRPAQQPSISPNVRQPPAQSSAPLASQPIATPQAQQAPTSDFNFDFEIAPVNRGPVTPVRPPVATAPQPAPQPMASEPFVAPQPTPGDDHDSIADLIAATFEEETSSEEKPFEPFVTETPQAERDEVQESFEGAFQPSPVSAAPVAEPGFARAEPDGFKVPPVFGLTSRSPESVMREAREPSFEAPSIDVFSPLDTAPPPAAEEPRLDDPMDEIENLIGNAALVGGEAPVESERLERLPPSPALRSLATPTLPEKPAVMPRSERSLSGADEAILAAAAAAGVEIGWVDERRGNTGGFTPADDEVEPHAPRTFRLPRSVIGPLVAVGLLAVTGGGLYWVLGMGGESGPPPVLTADPAPIKEIPEETTVTASQSVVFNEIDGVKPGADEQLVSRDQANVEEVTQMPVPTQTEPAAQDGLANRKVRTLTVRPDGTIVSAENSVAGSTILPVERPNVPSVPGDDVAASTTTAPVATQTPADTATATPSSTLPAITPDSAPIEPVAAPATTVAPVTAGAVVPVVDQNGAAIPGKTTTIPLNKPANFRPQAAPIMPSAMSAAPVASGGGNMLPPPPTTSLLPGARTQAAPAQPVQAEQVSLPGAVEVPALGNTAPAYVQLASQRSETEARTTAQAMVNRYGPLFGGASLEVQRVDLGDRGIFYRVRVPAASRGDAQNLCVNIKAAGGDCVLQ